MGICLDVMNSETLPSLGILQAQRPARQFILSSVSIRNLEWETMPGWHTQELVGL